MARRAANNKRTRVRSKPLEQLDETKLALAMWLMAKRLVEPGGETYPLPPAGDQAVPSADTPTASQPETT